MFLLMLTCLCVLFCPAYSRAEQLFSLQEEELSLEMHELLGIYVLRCQLTGAARNVITQERISPKARMSNVLNESSLVFYLPIKITSKPRNFIFKGHHELRGLTLIPADSDSLELRLHFNRLANFRISSVRKFLGEKEVVLYIQAPSSAQQALVWNKVETVDAIASSETNNSVTPVDEVMEIEENSSAIESADEFLSGAGSVLLRRDSDDITEDFFLDEPLPKKFKKRKSDGSLTTDSFPTVRYAPKDQIRKQGKPLRIFGVSFLRLSIVAGLFTFSLILFWLLSRRNLKERKAPKRRVRTKKAELKQPNLVDTSYQKALSVLGLPETSLDALELNDVRDRYKHLAKVFHADKLAAKELPAEMQTLAKDEFRKIKEAYNLLLNRLSKE